MDIDKALKYAREKHQGQYRRQGNDYIDHPIRAMELLEAKGLDSLDYRLSALFHDLLEDTDASEDEILALSNQRVLDIVKTLSKEEGYKNRDYIDRISKDPMAANVKMADRLSNLEDSLNIYDLEFIRSYLLETRDYYLDLAKNTPFYQDLLKLMDRLGDYIEKLENDL